MIKSYCGHKCEKCRTFRATINKDEELRKKSAEYYKTEFNWDLPLEKFRCFGCKSDEMMENCAACPFMKCNKEKGQDSCTECRNPCDLLKWYTEKYVNKANLV